MATNQVEIASSDLSNVPKRKAVYAIFAKSKDTGEPINCRYVGQTDNLHERTVAHFSKSEPNICLREFMQSNKTKILDYELMPNSTEDERKAKENSWIEKHNPECSE